MIQELIIIIEKVNEKITDNSDVVWTGYNSPEELRNELGLYIQQLKKGDLCCLKELHTHFLPTCTFQEHSLSNGWADEYLRLADQFDSLYNELKD